MNFIRQIRTKIIHNEQNFIPNVPKRVNRPNESVDVKKQRLIYQSRKRGILETDLLCSTFIHKYVHQMSNEELDQYDKLLDENDWDLFYYTSGERPVPEELKDNPVLKMLQKHFKETHFTRMPDLNNNTKE